MRNELTKKTHYFFEKEKKKRGENSLLPHPSTSTSFWPEANN